MKTVLVLCTGNSCRSQIAHGYLAQFAPEGTRVLSAGVETHGLNPRAIETMKADGIDISNHTSNNILEYDTDKIDFLITVCDSAKERCPYFPTKAFKFHHSFPDPAGATGTEVEVKGIFAEVRDEIKTYCTEFVSAYL
jgi:arsenate reductase